MEKIEDVGERKEERHNGGMLGQEPEKLAHSQPAKDAGSGSWGRDWSKRKS